MNELTYTAGVNDARTDVLEGWVPANFTLDSVVAQLRMNLNATDEYVAGYLSVLFFE